jgi:hypothetical protein
LSASTSIIITKPCGRRSISRRNRN